MKPAVMKLAIVSMLFSAALAAPPGQSLTFLDNGAYRFYYETGEEGGGHSRTEVRHPDGVVTGQFSYQDADGYVREVHYRADESGYVAEGDVGVKGAPKGRFPALEDSQQPEQPPPPTTENPPTTEEEDHPEPPGPSETRRQPTKHSGSSDDPAESRTDDDDDEGKADMQDLALDQSSASNDPPEGFPPGFFLNYHGLRRLPEPTKKAARPATTTTEAPRTDSPESNVPDGAQQGGDGGVDRETDTTAQPGDFNSYAPWYRFYGPPRQHHSEWADAMFHHPPVYVFSYQQPDAYGYHYYF